MGQAVIKNADMAEDMQQDAIDCATQALEKYNIETLGRQKGVAVLQQRRCAEIGWMAGRSGGRVEAEGERDGESLCVLEIVCM
eukprot:Skav231068  [mRNA]  locus=scaffold524:150478:150809:+ [translate_table: standard]